MADWNQLPDSALGSALSFLNEMDGRVLVLAAPCVSKGWRQACKHLRARIDLSAEWASHLTDAGLQSVIRRFAKAVSISLAKQGRVVTDNGVAKLAAGCPQLSSLDLVECYKVTDKGVGKLTAGCLQLSSLGLGYCSEVTDAGVGKLAADCPWLSFLNLVECYKMTDKGVGKLAAGCPQLSSLNFSGCSEVTDESRDTVSRLPPRLLT